MARRWGLLTVVPFVALLVLPIAPARADDANQSQQWGLSQIHAPQAWATATGAGVPIAVVDTGVDRTHPDLSSKVRSVTTCRNTGGDWHQCSGDGQDTHGHGTHVSGIAAAARNGAGVVGVAPDADIYAAAVLFKDNDPTSPTYGEAVGSGDDIIAGIRWAVATAPRPGVINLSLGEEIAIVGAPAPWQASFVGAIEEAWKAGWVVVVAAGNPTLGGASGANYRGVDALVVGATGPSGGVASYSGSLANTKWGIVAPGGDTGAVDDCTSRPASCVVSDWPGGRLAYLQGTSMATPHAAGLAALLLGLGLTNSQAVQRMLSTADTSVACGAGCSGRIDAARAVAGLSPPAAAAPGPASPPAAPSSGTPPRASSPPPGAAASHPPTVAGPMAAPEPAAGDPAPAPPNAVGSEALGATDTTMPASGALPAPPAPRTIGSPSGGAERRLPLVPPLVAAGLVLSIAGLAARRIRAGAAP
ncbi:MAG TPA: S8 family serine peptidase [Acidimicrobiales bacterium]|nr:S8 family serine peptidase [Acidimicrobiales bacterium]